ncbi:hypothetical protein [Aquitalea sp. ASV15]|uniref:hypothetical protein n=1 Tax=Aquitalea sp. ASV15 TaxID=2795104 RepID=UPI0018ED236F|nr:hypothetical protein [Aquitalea sp. ASV15]
MTEADIIQLIRDLDSAAERAILAELALLLGSSHQGSQLKLDDLQALSQPARSVFNQLCELLGTRARQPFSPTTTSTLLAILTTTQQA